MRRGPPRGRETEPQPAWCFLQRQVLVVLVLMVLVVLVLGVLVALPFCH